MSVPFMVGWKSQIKQVTVRQVGGPLLLTIPVQP